MSGSAASEQQGQQGIALVAVLWLLLLLSIIATGTMREARTETNLVRNGLASAKAKALADAGIQRGILVLLDESPDQSWRADGTPHQWPFADGEVTISIHDEAGKIDLNQASTPLLKGLFMAGGFDETPAAALADAVADFRDSNNLRRLNGAEDPDYRAAGYERGAKDAPFQRVAELRQVLGMTRTLYERIEHAVTIFSARATIDPTIASRTALLAIPGIDGGTVDSYLNQRPGEADNEDGKLPPRLSGYEAYLASDGDGSVFEIRAVARMSDGTTFQRKAIIRPTSLGGTPFKVASWD